MRSKARETALQYIYSAAKYGKDENLFVSIARSNKLSDEEMNFATKLADKVFEEKNNLIKLIKSYLINFSWDRVFFIDKIVLLIGFAEMTYFEETPKKVVIDEATNLSAKFSADNSPDFVNGILAKYYKDVQNGNDN